jgi:hypothetical protein
MKRGRKNCKDSEREKRNRGKGKQFIRKERKIKKKVRRKEDCASCMKIIEERERERERAREREREHDTLAEKNERYMTLTRELHMTPTT